MSLQLMKYRMNNRGDTARDEMIRDGQNLLKEELEHDSSYSPTLLFYPYDYNKGSDGECANLRIYNRKKDSTYGEVQNFVSTYDNPIKKGMYFHDTKDDTYWIATESYNVNDIQFEGKMAKCIYTLRWQDSDGNIIERKAVTCDQTKYSNGQTGNSTIMVADNQYGLLVPIDEVTKNLKREMRFSFDFDDIDNPDIYRLSNRKINLDEGIIQLSFSFDAFNSTTDKKVTLDDGKQVWICDYSSSTSSIPSTEEMLVSIVGSDTLRINRTKTWTVEFKGKGENNVEVDNWKWNIKADFDMSELVMQESDFDIKITTQDDDSLVDESFLLQILDDDGTILAEKEIDIIDGF